MFPSIRRLFHWGPLAVLGIIKLITGTMVHLMGMWWPPHESMGGVLHAVMFLGLAVSTLYYFLLALLEGPGFVPLKWMPANEADTVKLQFCTICKGYKAPRSHHCRKCGHCVMKMDHHCPWINCCVGHANHRYFTMFLISAVLGCLHAAIVQSTCLYHAINRLRYIHHGMGHEPIIVLTLTSLLVTLLATGMAIGVVLAVSVLLYLQVRGMVRNRTTIEDWIVEKAVCRRQDQGLPPFVFPYDLGWRRNIHLVWNWTSYDGIQWPVISGCGEYDLTSEQKAQKEDKRLRARPYTATRAYSGRWLPFLSFPRPALHAPCTDEPRLPLLPGERLRVTRQRRHWLFGEKVTGAGDGARGARGWFPRCAVAPAHTHHNDHDNHSSHDTRQILKHKPD